MTTPNVPAILSSGLLTVFLLLGSGCSIPKQHPMAGVIYTNPVYAADMPDPSVKKIGDYYYAYGTTGDRRLPDGRVFKVLRSRDLVHWKLLGGALTPPSGDARYQYWAPEIAGNNGKFYLYYAMGGVEPEHFVLRVGVSDQPQGPFADSGVILKDAENNRFTIDPYPFRDDDGQWYLFYAVDFPNESQGFHAGTGIVADRLLDMTRLAGQRQVIVRAAHDWTLFEANRRMDVFHGTFNWHTIEGPCVVKHDGRYYCFYSGANWQTPRYGVDFVVADKPLGPYSEGGNHARVLEGGGQVIGPGGNAVVTGPDGHTQYIVYHAWNQRMTERQLHIDRLKWTPSGPYAIATITRQAVELNK